MPAINVSFIPGFHLHYNFIFKCIDVLKIPINVFIYSFCLYGLMLINLSTSATLKHSKIFHSVGMYLFFKRFYLFIFRESGREGEGERNISVREKHRTHNLGMCPDQEWNPQPFGVQDSAPTEPSSQD